MAKKKTDEPKENLTEEQLQKKADKELNDIFDDVNKIIGDSSYLNDNALSSVDDWIDTGCYVLNAIISGSFFKGVPVGRTCGFVGPNSSGKTMIMCKVASYAIKKGFRVLYVDSENALDPVTAKRLGCDLSKIKHVPVETIEETKKVVLEFLNQLIEKNIKSKVLIIVDSLGGLNTLKDLEPDSNMNDMGLKAKLMGNFLKSVNSRAAKADVPVLFSNHIYENPGEMYPTLVKKQSGGLKVLYLASCLVQLSTTLKKFADSKEETHGIIDTIAGKDLNALTTKNRFAPEYAKAQMYLSYQKGLDRYSGLLEMAISLGYIKNTGATYVMGDKKLGYASTFDNPEFWEEHLPALEIKLHEMFQYSDASTANDDIKKEIEELEKGLSDEETP